MDYYLLGREYFGEQGCFFGVETSEGCWRNFARRNTRGTVIVRPGVYGCEHCKLILVIHALWEICCKLTQSLVHCNMIEDGETQEETHHGNRTGCCIHREKSNKTHLGQINTNHKMLKCSGIGCTLSIDIVGDNIESVVSRSDVNESEPNTGKS